MPTTLIIRFMVLLLFVSSSLISADIKNDTLELIRATAKGLCSLQQEDGAWTDPNTVLLIPLITPFDPPGEKAAKAKSEVYDPYLILLEETGIAAAALRSVQDFYPEAKAHADKALKLMVNSIISHPNQPISANQAMAFLRLHPQISFEDSEDTKAVVIRCKKIIAEEISRLTIGDVSLGIRDPNVSDHVNLQLTWKTVPFANGSRFRSYLPDKPNSELHRIDILQPIFATIHTDTPSINPSNHAFFDGTLFAVAMEFDSQPYFNLVKPILENELAINLSSDYFDAAIQIVEGIEEEDSHWVRAWFNDWTVKFIANCNKDISMQGLSLYWPSPYKSQAINNSFGLRFLLASYKNFNRQNYLTFKIKRLNGKLDHFASSQNSNGSWVDSQLKKDVTALTALAFLGSGYDHKTPNKHKKTLSKALEFLTSNYDASAHTLLENAWVFFLLAETHSMTNDDDLIIHLRHLFDSINKGKLTQGGWSDGQKNSINWEASAIIAKSLHVIDYLELVSSKDISAWWFSSIETNDDALSESIVYQTFGASFLWKSYPDGEKVWSGLLSRHLSLLEKVNIENPVRTWMSAEIIYQSKIVKDISDWRSRRMNSNPIVKSFSDEIYVYITDSYFYRYIN